MPKACPCGCRRQIGLDWHGMAAAYVQVNATRELLKRWWTLACERTPDEERRMAEAEECYRGALAYFEAVGASRRLVAASHAYAVALRAWGRPEKALEVLDHAHAVTAHHQQGEDT